MCCGGEAAGTFCFSPSSLLIFLSAAQICKLFLYVFLLVRFLSAWQRQCDILLEGEVSSFMSQNEFTGNNRRVLALYRKEILGTNCTERSNKKKNTQYLTSPRWNTADHITQPCCHVRPAGEFSSVWLCWWRGRGLVSAAALIGQAEPSSVSSSKWRHVKPVRLQLGPDCFPEALEASPCLLAHRGGSREHPTVSGADLSWHERSPFSYEAKNVTHTHRQAWAHTPYLSHKPKCITATVDVFKPVHSCIKLASIGFYVRYA